MLRAPAPTWSLSAADADRESSVRGPQSPQLPVLVPSAPASPLGPDGLCQGTKLSRSEKRWTCLRTCTNPARKQPVADVSHGTKTLTERGLGAKGREPWHPPQGLIALLAESQCPISSFHATPETSDAFSYTKWSHFLRERIQRLA